LARSDQPSKGARTQPADEYQRYLVGLRADAQVWRESADEAGGSTDDLDAAIDDLDEEINSAGMRGNVFG
jgi:hypothetical protein